MSEHDETIKSNFVNHMKEEIFTNIGDIIEKKVHEAQTLNQPLEEFLGIMNKEFALKLTDEQMKSFVDL
jgi:hypothetical protein